VKQSLEQKKLLEKASDHYEQNVELAESYLKSRGLSLADAKRHRLGVVNKPVVGHEMFEGRLSIPYLTPSGMVDLRFRAINNEEPKYLSLPNSSTRLYNVKSFFEAKEWICVCEGEIDTITLSKLGYPAVGIPGVKNIKRHYYRILADFDKIYVFADGDTAGKEFAKDLAKKLAGVVQIQLPDGEDVNSLFTKNGSQWFEERIDNENI